MICIDFSFRNGLARVCAVASVAVFLSASVASAASRETPNFNLLDLQGQNFELHRAEGRAVVLFFTGVGCPIARKSVAKLNALKRQFGKQGVTFCVIDAYSEDSTRMFADEANKLDLVRRFPCLRDSRQCVALSLGVQRTAEVVAIGTRDWSVFYQGAIDDQFAEGAERSKPQEQFLGTALTEFLADKPVTQARTKAHGCRIAFAQTGSSDEAPSYARDVAPILQKHCVQCHREGAIGPWSMSDHARVKNYSRMIEEVVLSRRMPPWDPNPDYGHFANANVLPRGEAQTLIRWVQAGAPRGDGPDPLTEPLPPLNDWPLGKPDLVLRLEKPQQIPATGVLEYRYIRTTPSVLTNEVWLASVDIKPSNRKIVHHAIVYAKGPGYKDDGSGKGMFVAGWAPGMPSLRYPAGVGKRLLPGAELTVEMHYTTCGTPETDQTEAALYFCPGPQPRVAETRQAAEWNINLPPGSDDARHTAIYGFKRPATIYSLDPHMHVRGKWMRYELLLPNGTKETLIDVPRYDFKWQFIYELAEPRHVPAGSWLLVTGGFDNSTANPSNPDPKVRVRAGAQSWDEMFIGFFEAADDPAPQTASASAP